jgi:hypothetical protein
VADEARWRNLDDEVAGAAEAHQRLLAALTSVEGDSSELVGRAVTALNAQADAHRQRFEVQVSALPSARHSSSSPAVPLPESNPVEALRRSIWALEMAWAGSDWSRPDLIGLPYERWRLVEFTHLELGRDVPNVAFGLGDLPAGFVRRELRFQEMAWRARRPMGLGGLPDEVLALEPSERLGWFLGWVTLGGSDPATGLRAD